MTKDKALDLALEALESCDVVYTFGNGGYQQFDHLSVDIAITAIKQALVEPAQELGPEPFGYFQYDIRLDAWVQNRINNKGVAFYTKEKP
jgi:hypothetical protein